MPQYVAGAGQFPVLKQVMISVPQVKRVVKGLKYGLAILNR